MAKKKIKIESEEMSDPAEESQEVTEEENVESSEEEGSEEELLESRSGRDADFSVFENEASNEETAPSGSDNEDVTTLKAELRKSKENYLRALADLDNFKKRTTKERSELLKYQGERIFIDLLEVIDNFDRALTQGEGEQGGDDSESETSEEKALEEAKQFREGINLIHRMFLQVLEKWQVKGDSAVGQEFDPNKHEAISQMPSTDHPAGTVLNELEKSYFYKDKLIRAAKVVVSVAPEGEG